MNSDKRKKIWKRLQFWGGTLLVIVVGIGILAYVTYRKAMGPPPTPPGKSREFDERLADIDKDWLFIFQQGKRLVICDIFGNDLVVLPEIKPLRGDDLDLKWVEGRISPDGKRMTISHDQWGTWGIAEVTLGLVLVDLERKSGRVLIEAGSFATNWRHEDVFWLDSHTIFIGTSSAIGWLDGVGEVPSDGSYKIFGIDEASGWVSTPLVRGGLFDEHKPPLEWPTWGGERKVFHRAISAIWEPDGKMDDETRVPFADPEGAVADLKRIIAEGTLPPEPPEEVILKYQKLTSRARNMKLITAVSPYPIKVREATRTRLVWKILRRFGVKSRFRNEIRLNNRRVRLTHEDILWSGGKYKENLMIASESGPDGKMRDIEGYDRATLAKSIPVWVEELRLFMWQEKDGEAHLPVYIMDEKGHYRYWHRGVYWGRVPRRPLEKQAAEE